MGRDGRASLCLRLSAFRPATKVRAMLAKQRDRLIEKFATAGRALLYRFAPTGSKFSRRQRAQRVGVNQDQPRLMKSADKILPLGQVDGGLSADGGIDLCEQSRGRLNELDAAQINRGRKAGQIA